MVFLFILRWELAQRATTNAHTQNGYEIDTETQEEVGMRRDRYIVQCVTDSQRVVPTQEETVETPSDASSILQVQLASCVDQETLRPVVH